MEIGLAVADTGKPVAVSIYAKSLDVDLTPVSLYKTK